MLRSVAMGLAALMFLMIGVQARAEGGVYAVQCGDRAFLVGYDGSEILASDDLHAIFEVREGALFAAGSRGDYRLYDAGGSPVGDARFSMICDMGEVLIYRQGDRYGAMDAEGETLVAPQYDALVANGMGGFLATEVEDENSGLSRVLYLEPGVSARPTGVVTSDALSALCDGRMPYRGENGRFGCMDSQGRAAIPCAYDWIGAFEAGVAVAAQDGRYGLLDAEGAWRVAPAYVWMCRGAEIVAAMTDAGGMEVYGFEGERRYALRTEALQSAVIGDYVAVWEADMASLYNRMGRCIFEAPVATTFYPGTDGQVVVSEGEWGDAQVFLVDPDGTATEARFQRLLPLCPDRYAYYEMSGVEYYSEDLQSLQTSWDYENVRCGLADGKGKIVLPAEYREIVFAGEDRLLLYGEHEVLLTDLAGAPLWRSALD